MKQVNEFEKWAGGIITEFVKPQRSGADSDRTLPLSQDPIRQTKINNPHLSDQEAASKFLYDITQDFKQDTDELNKEKTQNDELRKRVADLSNRYSDLVQSDDATNNELERLKTLSGQLKTGQENRKLKSSEIAQILDQVKQLRAKPGITDEHYEELKKQVSDFKKQGVDPQQLAAFKQQLDNLTKQKYVDNGEFEKLRKFSDQVAQGQEQVTKGSAILTKELEKVEQDQVNLKRKTQDLENSIQRRLNKDTGRKKERRQMAARIDKIEPEIEKLKVLPNKEELKYVSQVPDFVSKFYDIVALDQKKQDAEIKGQEEINKQQSKEIGQLFGIAGVGKPQFKAANDSPEARSNLKKNAAQLKLVPNPLPPKPKKPIDLTQHDFGDLAESI
jgi:chromosome segregation ATPase